jgi:O-antigen/teichoic acid export membrane protein
VREISREGADESYILGRVVSLRIVSSLLIALCSPIVFLFVHYPLQVEIGIWLASIAVLFSSFSLFLNGIFQKNIAMDRVAMVEFLGKIIQVSLIFIIIKQDLGFLAVASTLLISLSFNAGMAYYLSRKYIKFPFVVDVEFWKRFLKESFPLGVSALITFFYFKMDTILLSILKGSAAVGTYGVAYKVMENLTFFPAMLAGLIIPLLSRFILTDRKRFNDIADTTFRVFWILALPIVIGTIFLTTHIIAIVSGSGFDESVPVLKFLIFSLFFIFFGNYFNMILIVGNLQKKLMKALFFVAIFNVGINILLIREYSYLGAAFTSMMTEFLVVMVTGMIAYRNLQYRPSFRNIHRVLLSGVVMGIVLYGTASLPFLVTGLSGVISYIVSLWVFHAVTREELMILFSKNEFQNIEPEVDLP